MSKLRILLVTDFIFPDIKGGSGRLVLETAKALAKKGHNVCILTQKTKQQSLDLEEIAGVKIYRHRISYANPLAFVVSAFRSSLKTFNSIIKQTSFNVIIFYQPLCALGIVGARSACDIPKLYHFNSSWPEEYQVKTGRRGAGFFIRRWLEKKVLKASYKVIVLGQFSKDKILQLYPQLNLNVEIIHPGVDIEKFKPSQDKASLRAKLGIPQDKFILFTIRRLTARMGLENLIEAMVTIREKYKNILLLVGGEGSLKEALEKRTKDLQLENYIRFLGNVEDDALPLYYQLADIFILPSKSLEGFGLVTLEALACGLIVLGTPVGETVNILRQLDESFLFKGPDSSSLAELVIKKLSILQDERNQIQHKCRQFVVDNYSWQKTASLLESLISRAVRK